MNSASTSVSTHAGSMFAAERATPRWHTAGMAIPIGLSPTESANLPAISSTTSATASGVAG